MKHKVNVENCVLLCLIAAVSIGNTSYNGAALSTLKEQERYKAEKFYIEEKEKELQSKDRDYLNDYIKSLNDMSASYEGISNQSFQVETPNGEQSGELASAYASYKKKNNDTIGWIKIDGTQVDYPIMYNPDNNYYLNRTADKVPSKYGAIFLDQQSKGHWGIFNLIHGHNMNNGSMFADVAKMMDPYYLENHNKIQVYDGKELKEYTSFICMKLDDRKETIPVQYSSLKEYHDKIDHYMTRSRALGDYPKDCTDFLILNTCWYGDSGGEKNLHAIIIAYRSK